MRRSSIVCLAFIAALPLLSAGCNRPGNGTEITFRTLAEPGSAEYQLLEAVLAEFGRQHPDITVHLAGSRLQRDYQMRRIVAREAADVIDTRGSEIEFLAKHGALTPLTIEPVPELHRNAWLPASLDNQLYALPWAAQPKLLLYNKKAFQEAGLPADTPPRTWDELRYTAATLTRRLDGATSERYGFALPGKASEDFGRFFATLLAQTGRPLVSVTEGRLRFNLSILEAQHVMQFLLDLKPSAPPECVVSDDGDALEQFQTGRAAMVIAGPEALSPVKGLPASDIGVAPIPLPPAGQPRARVIFRYLAIPAFVSGPKRTAALTLIQFIAGPKAQRILGHGTADSRPLVPVQLDLLNDWNKTRGQLALFAKALDNATPVFSILLWEGKCAKDWINELHSLLIDDPRTLDDVMNAANTRADQALASLYTDIGNPSVTVTLGMILVAAAVFVAVAYAASRH